MEILRRNFITFSDEIGDWSALGTQAFFAAMLGMLLAVGLYLIVAA